MPQHISLRRPRETGRIASLAGCFFLVSVIFLFSARPALAQRDAAFAFLPDAAAGMDVREAASVKKAGEYQLYIPSFMAFSRLPENFTGAIWFRITLGPSFEKPAGGLRIDFGPEMPGVTRLYVPKGDGFAAIDASPSPAVFTIPSSGELPEALYARMDGTPGLWFRPLITDAGTARNTPPPPNLMLAGLFGAAMLLLLLQYMREAKEWRFWAAVTAGCGITAAVLPATPAAGAAYTPLMAAGILMPGLIIVFFAHTARHLFNAPKNLAGYDAFLAGYYILGGAVALFPLIPGFLYLSRYLPLSFALFLPLIFIAVAALGRSLKGAGPFLCACLLAVAGVSVSAWELTASGQPLIGGFGGLAGLGLGLALLGLTGPAKAKGSEEAEDDVFDSLHRVGRPEDRPEQPLAIAPWNSAEENGEAATGNPAPQTAAPQPPASNPEGDESPSPIEASFPLEPAFRPEEAAPPAPAAEISLVDDLPAVDSPAGEGAAYRSPFAEKSGPALFDLPMLVKNAYDDISPLAERKNLGMSWFIAPQTGRLFKGDNVLLDSALRMLLRDMVGAIDRGNVRLTVRRFPDGEGAGHIVFTFTEWDARQTFYARNMAGLSEAWALAEQTGGIFSVEHSPTNGTSVIFSSVFTPVDSPKGTTEAEQAVHAAPLPEAAGTAQKEAAEQAVSPIARDAFAPPPDEPHPGGIVQNFADYPDTALPEGFGSLIPASVPAGPDGEDLMEDAGTDRAPSRLIVADITASGRARLKAAFAGSPYSVLEGTSPQTAFALYKRNPSALVVMSAAMPEADIAEAVRDMHAEDAGAGRTPVPVLTIVEHEAQAGRMARIGCAKTLMKPLDGDALLSAALELAPLNHTGPDDTGRAGHKTAGPETLPIPAEALASAPGQAETPDAGPMPQERAIPVPAEALEPTLHATEPAGAPAVPPAPEPRAPARPGDAPVTAGPEAPPALSPETILNAALNDIPEKPLPAEDAAPVEAARSGIFSAALPAAGDEPAAGAEGAEKNGSGLSLIDMIVTDEEEDAPGKPEEKPPLPPAEPRTPAAAAPETGVLPAPRIKTLIRSKKIVKKYLAPSLSDPEPSFDGAPPAAALVTDDGRIQSDSVSFSGISIQLPGEEDGIFKHMMPLVPGLVHELADAMNDAAKGREEKNPALVREAAERVAGKAEIFGLAKLERMARCVERAAAADDVEPMECVLDDLANWIERYKQALSLLHREGKW